MSGQLWVTYAWADNEDNDIDYIVERLEGAGLAVRFDRRELISGQRIWDQIGALISDRSKVDAFAFIVTPNSLASEPCKEELAYAIQNVMDRREEKFPVIGLMHRVQAQALPPVLKARLCVPLSAPNWIEQVVAGVNKQAPPYRPENLSPYNVLTQKVQSGFLIQVTPRVEHLSPVIVCVDLDQHENGNVTDAYQAPAGSVPGSDGRHSIVKQNLGDGTSQLPDAMPIFFWQRGNEATPSQSYWIKCRALPSRIWFGNEQRSLTLIEIR